MLNNLAKDITAHMTKQGFWEDDNIPTKLMLIVSEVAEAMEAHRKDRYAEHDYFEWWEKSGWDAANKFEDCFSKSIKDSFEDELADTLIRLLDLAGHLNIDLDFHVEQKMKYNKGREFKHGKKY